MKIIQSIIPEILILYPKIFNDNRGFFFESFNQHVFDKALGRKINFVQDNHSKSYRGVLRGLHYQLSPYAQGKLVRCIFGEIFDVAVDIRKSSKTFSQWVGIYLSAERKQQIWIPEGFAHGFLVLSEKAELSYKLTNYYCSRLERTIVYNDPQLNIQWPYECGTKLNISLKDKLARKLITISNKELF